MTIGAVLIVKNEEAMLDRCLQSLVSLDEIVVLDTGSNDKTCEIARKYTNHVYENEYKWNDSFAEARNNALGRSTADYVLSIDADEYLEPGGIEKIRKVISDNPDIITFDIILKDEKSGSTHRFPRLFKRVPEIHWEGAIHNHLNKLGQIATDIMITYGVSPAHQNDPDRAMRILSNFVADNPRCKREKFYLAREHMYRGQWQSAIDWYETYLLVADFSQEIAEALYQCAIAYKNLGNYERARKRCIESIYINSDYSRPIELLAYLSGPINKDRWLEFSETAKNRNVLFVPGSREKGAEYYDKIFTSDTTFDRYDNIHDRIVEILGDDLVLDIGCGNGRLLQKVKNKGSWGFDMSPEAVKIGQKARARCALGNVYEFDFAKLVPDYVYVMTEVLEHVDDIRVIERLSGGHKCIITVPSFLDPSHVRFYTKDSFIRRLGKYFHDMTFEFFYWDRESRKWTKDHQYTNDYIILITAIKNINVS